MSNTTPTRTMSNITPTRTGAPVKLSEVTDDMLAQAREWADSSGQPQTVYPSIHYGRNYKGRGMLLATSTVGLDIRPRDAAPNEDALFTVLPANYLRIMQMYLLDVAGELA